MGLGRVLEIVGFDYVLVGMLAEIVLGRSCVRAGQGMGIFLFGLVHVF